MREWWIDGGDGVIDSSWSGGWMRVMDCGALGDARDGVVDGCE